MKFERRTNNAKVILVGAFIASAVSITSCSSDQQSPAVATYEATIRYTGYGVPHILADNWANLGFGQG